MGERGFPGAVSMGFTDAVAIGLIDEAEGVIIGLAGVLLEVVAGLATTAETDGLAGVTLGGSAETVDVPLGMAMRTGFISLTGLFDEVIGAVEVAGFDALLEASEGSCTLSLLTYAIDLTVSV